MKIEKEHPIIQDTSFEKNNSKSKAKQVLMTCLSKRDYLSTELEQKLRSKGFDQTIVDEVLEDAKSNGWLDDHRVVKLIIDSKQSKGYGPLWIECDLKKRNAPESLIDQHVQNNDPKFMESLHRFVSKKFSQKDLHTFEVLQKIKQTLFRRGFTSEQIYAYFKDLEKV